MVDHESEPRGRRNERAAGRQADARADERGSAGGEFLDEDGYNVEHERRDPGNPLWSWGPATVLVVAGALFVLLPEPITSGLGVLLIAVGVLVWIIEVGG